MQKTINGYFWPYRIDDMGNVEREKTPGKWVPIKPFIKRRDKKQGAYGRLCVRMKDVDGKWHNVFVKNLVVDAFLGGRKPGEHYGHRNGFIQDCSVYNLVKVTEKEVGEKTGGASRRAVEKVDKRGRVVALYSSVTEAAEKNYMSRKAIWMRCTKRVRNPYSLDGHTYRYER